MSEDFNIEELLREHLNDATEPTPPDIFGEIDARLAGDERRKKRFFIWFWIGASILILLAGALIATFNSGEDSTNLVAHHYNFIPATQKNSSVELHENDSIAPEKANEIGSINDLNQGDNDASQTATNENTLPTSRNGIVGNENLTTSIKTELNPNNTTGRSSIKSGTNRNLNGGGSSTGQGVDNNEYTEVDPDSDTQRGDKNQSIVDQSQTQFEENPSGNLVKAERQNSDSTLSENQGVNSAGSVERDPIEHTPPQKGANTTIVESQVESDSTKLDDINPPITLGKTILASPDTTAKPDKEGRTNSFGLVAYGGYLAFDQAVFKSYFSSGNLSKTIFPSAGYEIGLGAFYRFNERFEISLIGNYGARQSSFNYDLMISQNDFFNNYENDIDIPIENLDDPNTCNCFLAQDAKLDYAIQTVSFAFTASYDLIKTDKYSIGPSIGFGTIANTKFTNRQSTIISFSSELKEQFIGTVLRMGLNLHYQIAPKVQLGIAPSFNLQLANKSAIYGKNSRLLLVPLQLKFTF